MKMALHNKTAPQAHIVSLLHRSNDDIFSSLLVAVDKKLLAHLLVNYYEVVKALVCEIMFRYIFQRCNALRLLHPTPATKYWKL
jgi:hypothetical protein